MPRASRRSPPGKGPRARPRPALPAVLLPGFDGSGRLFGPFLAAGPRRIRPAVVSYPPDRPLGLDGLQELARAALPARGRYLLLAESFSGPIAVQLAAERPRGLCGLVLAATYLRRPLRPWLAPLRGLVGERFFALPMPGWMIRALMAGDDAPPEVVALVREAVAGVRPEVLARRAAEGLAVDAREALRRVEVPVLCLAAIRDRLLGGRGAEEVRALCPGATVIRIEAPHMVLQRAPQACLLAIERFADRVGGRTGPARGTRGKGEGDPAGPQRHREEPQRRSPRLAAKRKHEASRQPPSSTGRPAPTASEAASRGRRA